MNIRFKTRLIVLAAALSCAFAGVAAAADVKPRLIRFGYGLNDDSVQGRAARHLAQELEKISGGKLKMKTFEMCIRDSAYVEQLRVAFGLDKPVLTQLFLYLKGVVQLDLGFSYRNHVPVLDLIVERLPATFLLMSCAFVFSIVLGVLLGVVAAKARYRNKRRWIDSSVMTGALLLYATPLFWLSLMGILLFLSLIHI